MPMKVDDFMTRRVISLEPGLTLRMAIERMETHSIRHFPIVEGGKLLGVVSDRDIYKTLPALTSLQQLPIAETLDSVTVGMVMTQPVMTVGPEDTSLTAAKVFVARKIGCLPVVDPASGEVLGIITPRDVLRSAVQSGQLAR